MVIDKFYLDRCLVLSRLCPDVSIPLKSMTDSLSYLEHLPLTTATGVWIKAKHSNSRGPPYDSLQNATFASSCCFHNCVRQFLVCSPLKETRKSQRHSLEVESSAFSTTPWTYHFIWCVLPRQKCSFLEESLWAKCSFYLMLPIGSLTLKPLKRTLRNTIDSSFGSTKLILTCILFFANAPCPISCCRHCLFAKWYVCSKLTTLFEEGPAKRRNFFVHAWELHEKKHFRRVQPKRLHN